MKAKLRLSVQLPVSLVFMLIFLLTGKPGFSQAICGFDRMHKTKMSEDVEYRKMFNANEESLRKYISEHKNELLTPSSPNVTLYTIPVVVHVVHTGGAVGTIYNPSDAQIIGAINYLNQVFNGTYPGTEGVGEIQIQFVLAARGTDCTGSSGIDRVNGSSLAGYTANGVNYINTTGVEDIDLKNFSRWDPSSYYNIWVVNRIDGNDGTSGQFIAGYAYFAGSPTSLDGTVMLATQMVAGQKTLPHEIGHALNLYHPFEGSADQNSCPANTDCTQNGDEVCDTDPITYNQLGGIINFACRTGTNSCTGTPYSINTERNYMNYTSCYTLFTAGQKTRMLAAMSLPGRASLASSWALPGAYPVTPYTPPIAASCTPVTSATGLSNHFAGILSVSINGRTVSSSTARADGGYLNKSTECLSLFTAQRNVTYNFSAQLLGANNEQLRAWIDYNNNGVFDNATEQIFYVASVPPVGGGNAVTVSGNFTVPATAVQNTPLRIRVLEELSTIHGAGLTITSACYNPTYGQAEDYTLFINAALPVKLGIFNAKKVNETAELSWNTLEEQNSKGFDIERSHNGSDFTKVGYMPAAGNSSVENRYRFTDQQLSEGNNYYRLKSIDFDGRFEYSSVALVKNAGEVKGAMKVLANPFNQYIDIEFTTVHTGNTQIRLLDMSGRIVFQAIASLTNQSRYRVDLSNKNVAPGMYLLEATNNGKRTVEKVIKQ